METPKSAIVTTTIYVPKLLDAYAKDAQAHGHAPLFVVVGDKKTPAETESYCADLAARTGLRVEYFSPVQQDEYLSKFPSLKEHLVWNSIQRRNVGMLYAYEEGCEQIVTIDDDNFLVTEDYLGAHKVAGEHSATLVSSSTNWLNICQLLSEKHGRTFYHRGFPLEKKMPDEQWTEKESSVRPVVSAGLWLGDPDVDAMERLYYLADPTDAVKYEREGKLNISLAPGTWSPFNSQNTALARKVIPAYFLSPRVGRYDDIWASYVVKHIADHLGDAIVFGSPIVRQERNPHNYWRDLDNERSGHALTLRFVESLATIKLSGKDYRSCYQEITERLPNALISRTDIRGDEKPFLEGYFTGMRIWRDVFVNLK